MMVTAVAVQLSDLWLLYGTVVKALFSAYCMAPLIYVDLCRIGHQQGARGAPYKTCLFGYCQRGTGVLIAS